MALLTYYCMQIAEFRQVVVTSTIEVETSMTSYEWSNTNLLLGHDNESEIELFKGTLGCKTGVTKSAGPCFSGFFSRGQNRCIVVILKSKSMEARWVEVPALVRWYAKVKKLATARNFDFNLI
jgi:D-alanyl-D-alanine carboxypeptidase